MACFLAAFNSRSALGATTPEVPFAPGTVSSGSLQTGQRLAKPGLSGFNSNSSPQTAQIFMGNGMIFMLNRGDSSRKGRSGVPA